MNKLRLTDWASIAEVIGALGLVISLIYVGVQVRHNTEEIRMTNRQQLVGRAHTATNNVATNEGLARAFAKVLNGETLTPTEQTQYSFFTRSMLYDVQEALLLYQEERLDKNYWKTRSALFEVYMKSELALNIYNRDKSLGLFHRDFVAWADSILAEMP